MSAEPVPSAPPVQRLRLRSFEIAGFRSFSKPVTLEFGAPGKEPDEIVVFHGPNGSGKSAAIAAMERLVNLLSRSLTNGQELHGYERAFESSELVVSANDRSTGGACTRDGADLTPRLPPQPLSLSG